MAEIVWYRSLYWRVALGFVALLALLLLAQGAVFLWMTGRAAEIVLGRSAAELADEIAADVARTISNPSSTDLSEYINDRYRRTARGFVVVMRDSRVVTSQHVPPPPQLLPFAWARLRGETAPPGPAPDLFPPGRSGRGRGAGPPGSPFGGAELAEITVSGRRVGIVAVAADVAPLPFILNDLGPTLAAVGVALLVLGTAVGAFAIFRPVHRRLRVLQHAARSLGAGDTGVRATEEGGDEVTSLARAFNDMAQQLEERTAALEASGRLRRQLLADVSHELNTPLAAIRGYVETLGMTDVTLDQATRERYLRIVGEETVRLEHIVGDLLDLAKLDSSAGSFRSQPVDLRLLLDRVRDRHERVVGEKQIVLETTIDASRPSIVGDAIRLEQALQNLVANAIRHTPVGGRISVRCGPYGDGIQIVVEDTGPGIPAEHLQRVFDRFYKVDQARTGTTQPSGSGLGLSIVRAIVERHGGRVNAGNMAGGGARFEIVLPMAIGKNMPQDSDGTSES